LFSTCNGVIAVAIAAEVNSLMLVALGDFGKGLIGLEEVDELGRRFGHG
jgi:hypothetical protein